MNPKQQMPNDQDDLVDVEPEAAHYRGGSPAMPAVLLLG